MRPNVKTTRDVINAPALPPTAGMELDYRTEPHRPAKRNRWTFHAIAGAIVPAIAWTFLIRVTGAYTATIPFVLGVGLVVLVMAGWLTLGADFAFYFGLGGTILLCVVWSPLCILFLGPLALFHILLMKITESAGRPRTAPSVFAVGVSIWLLSVSCNTAFFAAFFLVGVLVILFVCETMTRHHALWMNANPYLPRRMRQRWLAIWRPPRNLNEWSKLAHSLIRQRSCRHTMLDAELAERTRYLLGYVVVLVACLFAVLLYVTCRDPLLRGTLAVAAFVIPLLAYGTLNVLADSSIQDVASALKIMLQGLVNWCTYNIHETAAPGVFRSPYGNAQRRTTLLQVAIWTLALVLLPACWYFPIGTHLIGVNGWLQAAAETDRLLPTWFPQFLQTEPTRPNVHTVKGAPLASQATSLAQVTASRNRESSILAMYGELTSSPERSLAIHARALCSLQPGPIFITMLSLAACAAVPLVVLMTTWWAVSSRVFLHHWRTLEGAGGKGGEYQRRPTPRPWAAYVSRLRDSRFRTRDFLGGTVSERDHLILGFGIEGDYPVLVSKAVLAEHAHITGDSGSGKSSLGLAPLVEQLIARGDCSVVVLDLKNDMPMFEATRIAVARANQRRNGRPPIPFRWFTNESGRSTYVFNPMLQRDMQLLTPLQRTEVLLSSLGLDYGEGFGPGYYSSVHRHVLGRVLESNPHLRSFRQIDRFFRDGRFAVEARAARIDKKSREEASHLYTIIESLGSFDALNVLDTTEIPDKARQDGIDMGDVVRSPHVLYFGLAAALEQKSVREIAKLALHSLLVAAVRRGYSEHQTYLFIDEFQQVVSHDLEIVLRQARSQRISVILANQTPSDLKTGPTDITPTVEANTRLRQTFSASDPQHQKALVQASGEALYEMISQSETVGYSGDNPTWSVSTTVSEQIGPRLRPNDIIEISDHPQLSVLHVTRSHGFTQFGGMSFPMRSWYHISPEVFHRRQMAAWPAAKDHAGTIVTPLDPALFGDTGTAPARPPGLTQQAAADFMELEKNLDAYQGVPTDDRVNVKPKH